MILTKEYNLWMNIEKRESFNFKFLNLIKTVFFFFTIHKTISTRAHIVGDNLPLLIFMVSCARDNHRKLHFQLM